MPLFFFPLIIIVISLLLLLLLFLSRRNFGVLTRPSFYIDTGTHPGQVLRSTSIPLVGKPDYLTKHKGQIIPVEVKTGHTPDTPAKHHVMQLLAYCYLVEENYGVTPEIAILKYPHREFRIGYSSDLRPQVQKIVAEILQMKQSGLEPHCHHPQHNIYHPHTSFS